MAGQWPQGVSGLWPEDTFDYLLGDAFLGPSSIGAGTNTSTSTPVTLTGVGTGITPSATSTITSSTASFTVPTGIGVGSTSTTTRTTTSRTATGGKRPRTTSRTSTGGKRPRSRPSTSRRVTATSSRTRAIGAGGGGGGGGGGDSSDDDGGDDSGRHGQRRIHEDLDGLLNRLRRRTGGRNIAGITHTDTITTTYKDGRAPTVRRSSSRSSGSNN